MQSHDINKDIMMSEIDSMNQLKFDFKEEKPMVSKVEIVQNIFWIFWIKSSRFQIFAFSSLNELFCSQFIFFCRFQALNLNKIDI